MSQSWPQYTAAAPQPTHDFATIIVQQPESSLALPQAGETRVVAAEHSGMSWQAPGAPMMSQMVKAGAEPQPALAKLGGVTADTCWKMSAARLSQVALVSAREGAMKQSTKRACAAMCMRSGAFMQRWSATLGCPMRETAGQSCSLLVDGAMLLKLQVY